MSSQIKASGTKRKGSTSSLVLHSGHPHTDTPPSLHACCLDFENFHEALGKLILCHSKLLGYTLKRKSILCKYLRMCDSQPSILPGVVLPREPAEAGDWGSKHSAWPHMPSVRMAWAVFRQTPRSPYFLGVSLPSAKSEPPEQPHGHRGPLSGMILDT